MLQRLQHFECGLTYCPERRAFHGTAIDINPVQNPYVAGSQVDPPAGSAYLNRADVRPGMLVRGGVGVNVFRFVGWGWGGDWTSAKDYQHVSLSGT